MAADQPCERDDCAGTIVDGYCDECGLAPDAAPALPDPSTAVTSRSSSAWTRRRPVSSRRSSCTNASSGGQSRVRRGGLGAGIVDVPPVPSRDPLAALLPDPALPEDKRRCDNCNEPVGRARDGRPGRTEGFCPSCGTPFSFSPRLAPGEVVGGQYEVRGCLGRGGLGWVYLAWDRKVEHWVVLKGLLNSGDEDAQRVAVAERRFLAEVEHPNIVRIYNFVEHADPRSGADVGYIVMAYAGGKSLRQLRDAEGPLALANVLAYGLEVLLALGYLHGRGLLYCDLKPDNVMLSEEQLWLIDLGGVRRMDDEDTDVWGTAGYQAPEIVDSGPSVASDLYSVGRMMARLSFDFPQFTTARAHSLPGPGEVPLLARHDSYYRLLLRATNPYPDRRFASAEAMAEQVYGVLREVVARDEGQRRPAPSTLFGPEMRAVSVTAAQHGAAAAAALALPLPLVDPNDPNAGLLATLGATPSSVALRALSELAVPSLEAELRSARAWLELGELEQAALALDAVEAAHPGHWRVLWHRGIEALAGARVDDAVEIFEAIYDAFPGEAAPKLALGLCAECQGEHEPAVHYYEMVWRTDHNYVNAAFGLTRARQAVDDEAGAAAALESVPETSSHAVTAHLAGILLRARGHAKAVQEGKPLDSEFFEVAARLEKLDLEDGRRLRAAAELLAVALAWLLTGRPAPPALDPGRPEGDVHTSVMGHELTERGVRLGLEGTLRKLAHLAGTPEERVRLVDQANAVRPRTWR